MDALPVEILLEIGRTDLADYHGMLNIPKFARAVTIGYRLDMMLVAGYNYKKILNNNEGSITRTHRTHKFSRLIGRTFPEITFITTTGISSKNITIGIILYLFVHILLMNINMFFFVNHVNKSGNKFICIIECALVAEGNPQCTFFEIANAEGSQYMTG